MTARFQNPQGYSLPKVDSKRRLGGLLASKAIYEYTTDLQAPLTFIDKDGRFRQPDRHLERTDLGSQPPIVQLFIPKDRYLLSVIFHDSAYAHHWTWIKGKDQFYYKTVITRKEADMLLREMVLVEGMMNLPKNKILRAIQIARTKADAAMMYAGVRAGGRFSW